MKLAGINKHVNLHLFRHSAATNAAKFMTEAQLRKRHGWTPDSNMTSRYVHLVNADVDDAIFEHYGIKPQENPEPAKLPKICQICQMPNTHDSTTCSRCLRPINLQAATLLEEKEREHEAALKEEIEKMQKRIEELEYGIKARSARYAKAMLELKDDDKAKSFLALFQMVFEMALPEEKKRELLMNKTKVRTSL